jgi:molybdate transport system substrate-binding protein
VRQPDRSAQGSYWLVPKDLHEPIEQQAALLTRAADDEVAKAFLAYLRSREARELIAAYGYGRD